MRFITRFGLVFGVILLGVVASLAYARRDEPAEWIIFTINDPNNQRSDVYRAQLDGSHLAKIATLDTTFVNGTEWASAGWLALQADAGNHQAYFLMRLDGRIKKVLEGRFQWVSLWNYDDERDVALLIVQQNVSKSYPQLFNFRTGALEPIELPFTNRNEWRRLKNGDYVFWSDETTDGDLYSWRRGQAPTPLTTRGDILESQPSIFIPDWFYFYAKTGDDLALYRIREDGTDEQLIADHVLLPYNAIHFYADDRLYYWSDAGESPHLVRANFDGSDPQALPIAPTTGWLVERIPELSLVYYLVLDTSISQSFETLRRLNLVTGEDVPIIDDRGVMNVQKIADGQWFLLWVQADGPYSLNYQMLRMRPDGTEQTVLMEDVPPMFYAAADGRVLVMSAGNDATSGIRTLDLATFEVRSIKDNAPSGLLRQVLDITTTPDLDGQPFMLGGGGVLLVGAVIVSRRRR